LYIGSQGTILVRRNEFAGDELASDSQTAALARIYA
jgi:hypothetical protein